MSKQPTQPPQTQAPAPRFVASVATNGVEVHFSRHQTRRQAAQACHDFIMTNDLATFRATIREDDPC